MLLRTYFAGDIPKFGSSYAARLSAVSFFIFALLGSNLLL
jgi:hypothetical protein